MKVIGSGFGRTGTLSMKAALEQLGFGPCYHMEEVLQRPSHIKLWHDVALNKPVAWSDIFSQFQATVDFPASAVYKELMVAYPEAKIIHTVRDPERWYDSTYETIYQTNEMFPNWMKKYMPPVRLFLEMSDGLFWDGIFKGDFENRPRMIEIFNEFTTRVERTVPPERLLIFNVRDGWQPLCQFLNVPVPDTPFPHVNDKATMLKRFRIIRLVTHWGPVMGMGVIAAWLYRWWQRPLTTKNTPA